MYNWIIDGLRMDELMDVFVNDLMLFRIQSYHISTDLCIVICTSHCPMCIDWRVHDTHRAVLTHGPNEHLPGGPTSIVNSYHKSPSALPFPGAHSAKKTSLICAILSVGWCLYIFFHLPYVGRI